MSEQDKEAWGGDFDAEQVVAAEKDDSKDKEEDDFEGHSLPDVGGMKIADPKEAIPEG